MKKPIWDIDDGDFIFRMSDNMAIDSDGNIMMRMSENMVMDISNGDIHFTSSWKQNKDDDTHGNGDY